MGGKMGLIGAVLAILTVALTLVWSSDMDRKSNEVRDTIHSKNELFDRRWDELSQSVAREQSETPPAARRAGAAVETAPQEPDPAPGPVLIRKKTSEESFADEMRRFENGKQELDKATRALRAAQDAALGRERP